VGSDAEGRGRADRDRTLGANEEKPRRSPLEIVRAGQLGGVFGSLLIDGPLDRDYYISQYDGEIAFTDKWNGVLLSALRALGLDGNTLVVFASDHGESLGEHDYYFQHGLFTYEASGRIPLIFSMPGVVKPGTRDGDVVESVDILPTVLEIIGARAPQSCQGRSFAWRVAQGFPAPSQEKKPMIGGGCAYMEAGYGHHSGPGYTFAVTDGTLKLIVRDSAWVIRPGSMRGFLYSINALIEGGADPPELYDISRDPNECVNIIEQHPGEELLLRAELDGFLRNVSAGGRLAPNEGEDTVDERTIRALRALGYMR
jgi:arylsulfatase A-like enzyme